MQERYQRRAAAQSFRPERELTIGTVPVCSCLFLFLLPGPWWSLVAVQTAKRREGQGGNTPLYLLTTAGILGVEAVAHVPLF